jgi:putative oxygen-independent coproporphyrinogen III oxidase
MSHYVEMLGEEIRLTPNRGAPLQTVFFGGGTPSLLSGGQLAEILGMLDRRFDIAAGAEISMEIDPGTFDLAQLQGYQKAGMNRFSFGVQAFQSELLQACGRAHTVADIAAAMAIVQQAGIENYSIDLISGLPNQTIANWQASLESAIAHQPTHISTYDLTVEAGTVFGKRYRPGEGPLPSDELTAQMYRLAHQVLTAAGYEHYEISNYAKPGYQCRHNRMYWENRSFYGFGMGATSYLEGDRLARPRHTDDYYDWVKQLEKGLPQVDPSSPEEILLDTLMVGLRLAEGLAIDQLIEQFGQSLMQQVWDCLKRYVDAGWVEVVDCQNQILPASVDFNHINRIRLTMPEGFLFSNVVLVALFDRLEPT